jgi:HEAT repeat protein
MAKELDSPDVQVRLRALDRWGQQAPTGSVDLLLLALEDEDERVQARALELIEQDEQDGGRAQAAENIE